ncbi:MAG: LPS assembly lipoprotein LptE [Chlamydiales bacterium]
MYSYLVFILSACGYRFSQKDLIGSYTSVCIPYVEGDNKGLLTNALIHAMTVSGALVYRAHGGDLLLKVVTASPLDTNIGFAYAPSNKEDDKFSDFIVSDEARLTMKATFSLIDHQTGDCIFGPYEAIASLTYDFDPDLTNINFHAFSLGQLEMHNLALDAATNRLYQILAQKIISIINHCW